MPIGQYWEILEELSARKNELASTRKELELNKKLLARQCDLAREAETETERWKTMVQRHNPSGCCCQINENNGDPQMVEPCAFHAEWRDTALETLRGKVREWKEWDDKHSSIAVGTDEWWYPHYKFAQAKTELRAAVVLVNLADNDERPDPGMNIYYKNRTIANTEKVSTESVTQPKIDFCYACGTALGGEG